MPLYTAMPSRCKNCGATLLAVTTSVLGYRCDRCNHLVQFQPGCLIIIIVVVIATLLILIGVMGHFRLTKDSAIGYFVDHPGSRLRWTVLAAVFHALSLVSAWSANGPYRKSGEGLFRYQIICAVSGAALAYGVYFFVFAKNRHEPVALAETAVGSLVACVLVIIFWIFTLLPKRPPGSDGAR